MSLFVLILFLLNIIKSFELKTPETYYLKNVIDGSSLVKHVPYGNPIHSRSSSSKSNHGSYYGQ